MILPKTRLERSLVQAALPERPAARVIVPERALPGLQLLYHSDMAISGGGTMNRESALLGVPTYSMFTGRRAAIDEELDDRGLLTFLERPSDVEKIVWEGGRRSRAGAYTRSPKVMYEVAGLVRSFVERCGAADGQISVGAAARASGRRAGASGDSSIPTSRCEED